MTTIENDQITLTEAEIKQIREALARYGHELEAKQVIDHYHPRLFRGECVAFESDNPMLFAMELCAILAARGLVDADPDRNPADHHSTFLDHLDWMREAAGMLGELGCDRSLDGPVWFWPSVVMQQPNQKRPGPGLDDQIQRARGRVRVAEARLREVSDSEHQPLIDAAKAAVERAHARGDAEAIRRSEDNLRRLMEALPEDSQAVAAQEALASAQRTLDALLRLQGQEDI